MLLGKSLSSTLLAVLIVMQMIAPAFATPKPEEQSKCAEDLLSQEEMEAQAKAEADAARLQQSSTAAAAEWDAKMAALSTETTPGLPQRARVATAKPVDPISETQDRKPEIMAAVPAIAALLSADKPGQTPWGAYVKIVVCEMIKKLGNRKRPGAAAQTFEDIATGKLEIEGPNVTPAVKKIMPILQQIGDGAMKFPGTNADISFASRFLKEYEMAREPIAFGSDQTSVAAAFGTGQADNATVYIDFTSGFVWQMSELPEAERFTFLQANHENISYITVPELFQILTALPASQHKQAYDMLKSELTTPWSMYTKNPMMQKAIESLDYNLAERIKTEHSEKEPSREMLVEERERQQQAEAERTGSTAQKASLGTRMAKAGVKALSKAQNSGLANRPKLLKRIAITMAGVLGIAAAVHYGPDLFKHDANPDKAVATQNAPAPQGPVTHAPRSASEAVKQARSHDLTPDQRTQLLDDFYQSNPDADLSTLDDTMVLEYSGALSNVDADKVLVKWASDNSDNGITKAQLQKMANAAHSSSAKSKILNMANGRK